MAYFDAHLRYMTYLFF